MKMRTDKRELDKIYKRRNRYEIPDWQRQEVWDDDRKRLLIDTMLRGWKLPKFYFVKTPENPEIYEVVDGQQRLAAIFAFLNGDLSLSPKTAEEFGGETYEKLPADVSDMLDDFVIDFDEIEDATDQELMDFFQRLQNGLPLNSTEKLYSIPSKLAAFCKLLTKQPFFTKKLAFKDTRYAYYDVATKVAAIEVEGFNVGLRFDDIREVLEGHAAFSDKSPTAKRIREALEFLDKATPAGSKSFRSRSLAQSFLTVVCRLTDGGALKGKEKVFGEFVTKFTEDLAAEVEKGHDATDADLIAFQRSVNANVKSGPITRHRVILRKLFQFDPTILDAAGDAGLENADFKGEIADAAHRIQALIANINEAHAATEGENLFRPTNKTVSAQHEIAIASEGEADFGKLIENLYFLLWEGPGSKLANKPKSFSDVKTLRTELQHDVEHGEDSGIKKKKLNHAAVFELYSGISSPALASPERFPLAHLKLLNAIRADLQALFASYA